MLLSLLFFFFNDTATTEIYTLSLHDALPILSPVERQEAKEMTVAQANTESAGAGQSASNSSESESQKLEEMRPDLQEIVRSEEHTSELQSQSNLVCRLLLEKKKKKKKIKKTE